MYSVIHLHTVVLPGGRIEVAHPNLPVGQSVDLAVTLTDIAPVSPTIGILDFLNSLPTGPRSTESWEEFERQFQEEKNSWERSPSQPVGGPTSTPSA